MNTLSSCLILLTLGMHSPTCLKWFFNSCIISFEHIRYIYPNNWMCLFISYICVSSGCLFDWWNYLLNMSYTFCITDIWILDIMMFTCWMLHFSCFLLACIHLMKLSSIRIFSFKCIVYLNIFALCFKCNWCETICYFCLLILTFFFYNLGLK